MPQIEITASFTVRFKKTVSEAFVQNLKNGMDITEVVDETEAYEALRTDGDCDMEWEEVAPTRRKKRPRARR